MKYRCLMLFVTLALTGSVEAQGDMMAEPDPCAQLNPTAPTPTACWNCFRHLVKDCTKADPGQPLPTPEEVKACCTGANTFFAWCLDRVGTWVPPLQQPEMQSWQSGMLLAYEVRVPLPGYGPSNLRIEVVQNGVLRPITPLYSVLLPNGNVEVGLDGTGLAQGAVALISIWNQPVTGIDKYGYADALRVPAVTN